MPDPFLYVPRDALGRTIEEGKVVKSYETDFLQQAVDGAALPWWLDTLEFGGAGGGITYSAPSASRSYAQITTAAANQAGYRLRVKFDIDLTKFREVRWWADGVDAQSGTVRIVIGCDVTTAGLYYRSQNASASPQANTKLLVKTAAAGTNTYDVPAWWSQQSEYQRRRNIMVRIVRRTWGDGTTKIYTLLHEGDQNDTPIFCRDVTSEMGTGAAVKLYIQAQSDQDSVAQWIRFSKFGFALIHN